MNAQDGDVMTGEDVPLDPHLWGLEPTEEEARDAAAGIGALEAEGPGAGRLREPPAWTAGRQLEQPWSSRELCNAHRELVIRQSPVELVHSRSS